MAECKSIIEAAHDAPKDLRHIIVELSSLKAVLEEPKFLADTDGDFPDTVKNLDRVDGAVNGCRVTVDNLSKELAGLTFEPPNQTQASKSKRLKTALI
ncbi:hypothetical protein P154DRAFT_570353 [Amniculicola lignicola CBS 123094]|uniref:Fungal N-terminal domain-containing protein n=1 Tax=Amniculicola lignicola CBS 123094 TaxID=1392246 RepID=A0A6A5WX21_9PLEO|nr:hypothetical protein P154DRAFT_570353 [Amniculicola lignicola CBS 123094]